MCLPFTINLSFLFTGKIQACCRKNFQMWKERKRREESRVPLAREKPFLRRPPQFARSSSLAPARSHQHQDGLASSLAFLCRGDAHLHELHCQVQGTEHNGDTEKALGNSSPSRWPHYSNCPRAPARAVGSDAQTRPAKALRRSPSALLEEWRHSYKSFQATDVISKRHERFPLHVYVTYIVHICPLRSLFEHLVLCCEPPRGWTGATAKPGSHA